MPAPRSRRIFAAALVLRGVHGYPEYVPCGEALRTGVRWMGRDSVESAYDIGLTDVATGASIACGATVSAGTRIKAVIADPTRDDGVLTNAQQWVLEAVGAANSYGNFCTNNKRANDAPLEFEADGTVSVIGAHAPTYGTVYVTPACAITGVGPMPTPRPTLTQRPSSRPTTALPTLGACASKRAGFEFAYALDGSLTLHWTLETDRVKAALVTDGGWAAWGWGSDGMMVGAESVIGEPGELPGKYRLEGYARRDIKPMQQTLVDASTIVEDDGSIVYAFTKLLEEPGELKVTKGTFIWARGPGSLAYHGSRVGALELDLETCDASTIKVETVSSKLIKIHGGLFLVAFSVCMPAALVAARGRSWLGPVWIRLHLYLMVLCFLLAVAGFIVVFAALEDVDKDHFRGRHQKVGLACLGFLLANIALGLARPGQEGKWRPHFNVAHACLGIGIFVLSIVATRSGATKAAHLHYMSSDAPWHVAQASLLGGFGALWLLAWARARRPKEDDPPVVKPGEEESKREG